MSIRTYDLEKEIAETISGDPDKERLLDACRRLGEKAVAFSVENQALTEAVLSVADEKQIKEITYKKKTATDRYLWRNTPGEDRSVLSNYGYKKPVVLCSKEEAFNTLDDGYPVLLLYGDNTEKRTTDPDEISRHIKAGGLLGVTQFVAEVYYERILSMSR